MAKIFDEDNVHHFWGLSPSIDVFDVLDDLPSTISQHSMLERFAQADALHILQASRALGLPNSQKTSKSSNEQHQVYTKMVITTDWRKRLPQLCKILGNCLQKADKLQPSVACLGVRRGPRGVGKAHAVTQRSSRHRTSGAAGK